jgi:hypothetical protein
MLRPRLAWKVVSSPEMITTEMMAKRTREPLARMPREET